LAASMRFTSTGSFPTWMRSIRLEPHSRLPGMASWQPKPRCSRPRPRGRSARATWPNSTETGLSRSWLMPRPRRPRGWCTWGGLESYEAGRRSTYRLGGHALLRWLDAQQAWAFHCVGEWDPALALLDGFLAESDAGALHYQDQLARLLRAQMRYGRGDVDGAFEDAKL